MRATVVYHYRSTGNNAIVGDPDTDMTPIACVSSYYDPSDKVTARNPTGLPDVSGGVNGNWAGSGLVTLARLADGSAPGAQPTAPPSPTDLGARSNNGVSYPFPGRTIDAALQRQARLVYPNGRVVNPWLRTALANTGTRTLAENAAIDSALCSLGILDGSLTPSDAIIPHGAIKEASFLDGRQVKSLNRLTNDVGGTPRDERQTDIAETLTQLAAAPAVYDLQLEQRQPVEVRVTEIDLNVLRRTQYVGSGGYTTGTVAGNNEEYLLPNSGIIYVARDDAQQDLSSAPSLDRLNTPNPQDQLTSATDFKADPSARPNGVRLVNGSNISRTNFFRTAEKGLILATNLPVYTMAENNNGFNLHREPDQTTPREEFNDLLNVGATGFWNNFYNRAEGGQDRNFACRQIQPGCERTGDQWRPATIIADAVTLLSNTFRDGFRNQGDFDLRNNIGNSAVQTGNPARPGYLPNGFWFNNFVTSADWEDTNGYPYPTGSSPQTDGTTKFRSNSYLTNGVTPIQRRVNNFPEYLMEYCPILPVSNCTPENWVFSPGQKASNLINTALPASTPASPNAGTTAVDADPSLQRFARRVAFLRNTAPNTNELVPGGGLPVPLGINGAGNIVRVPYDGTATFGDGVQPSVLRTGPNTNSMPLWFQTTSTPATPYLNDPGVARTYATNNHLLLYQRPQPPVTLTDQPQLVPMLHIHSPQTQASGADVGIANPPPASGVPPANSVPFGGGFIEFRWLQEVAADPVTYNASFVSRTTPSRPTNVPPNNNTSEAGGGLHNFVRLIEKWRTPANTALTARISGNFIQIGNSQYATGPFQAADPQQQSSLFYQNTPDYVNGMSPIPAGVDAGSWVYRTFTANARAPFFRFGRRAWGFDVGLLSQTPDLFAQRFTAPPAGDPNEYFRGVNRDDPWVNALLCAGEAKGGVGGDGQGGAGANYTTPAVSTPAVRNSLGCQLPLTSANYPNNPTAPEGG